MSGLHVIPGGAGADAGEGQRSSDVAELVQRVAGALDLPARAKARVLAELAFDLDGLYVHYLRQGEDREAALRRVEERLVASPQALRELESLHAPLHVRLLGRLGPGGGHAMERALLLVLLPMLILAATLPLAAGGMLVVSPLAWPVYACGLVVVVLVLLAAFADEPRTSERLLPAFAAAAPALAVAGAVVDLYMTAMRGATAPEASVARLLGWIMRAAGLFTVALVVLLSAALLWFLLRARRVRSTDLPLEA